MTWSELKIAVAAQGVQDTDTIRYVGLDLPVDGEPPALHVWRTEAGEVEVWTE
jgi:hypothetical protein